MDTRRFVLFFRLVCRDNGRDSHPQEVEVMALAVTTNASFSLFDDWSRIN